MCASIPHHPILPPHLTPSSTHPLPPQSTQHRPLLRITSRSHTPSPALPPSRRTLLPLQLQADASLDHRAQTPHPPQPSFAVIPIPTSTSRLTFALDSVRSAPGSTPPTFEIRSPDRLQPSDTLPLTLAISRVSYPTPSPSLNFSHPFSPSLQRSRPPTIVQLIGAATSLTPPRTPLRP